MKKNKKYSLHGLMKDAKQQKILFQREKLNRLLQVLFYIRVSITTFLTQPHLMKLKKCVA